MTTPMQPVPAAQPVPKVRFKVEPEESGQLEQLLIENKKAKDEADVAGERSDELKAAIKNWLLSLFPDGKGLPDAFDITADPHGRYPGYTMTLKGGERVDTKLLAANSPDVYRQFLRPIQKTWELREAGQGGRRR